MCRPVKCKTCGKTTWAGCGQHVAQVKAAVPAGQWCPGHPKGEKKASSASSPASAESAPKAGGGLLGRLFGR